MLKRLLYRAIFLGMLLPIATSCDNIDEQDRYIDTGEVEVERKVLLEEFTGQRCTNCPDAHRIIESLEEQYGDDLIVVSIHAGNFGISVKDGGLMQEEGNDYANRWDISAYPAGVVDRTGLVMTMNQWATAIREDLLKPADFQLSLEAQLSEDGKRIEVFTTMVSPRALNGYLQLWVVENGIVGFQIDNGTRLPDYVHNNVFRGCVNGLWGESIPLKGNVVEYNSSEIAINDEWVVENLRIVGFYYTDSGVVQVERCGIGN